MFNQEKISMANNHSSLSITYLDYDLERTTITVEGAPVLDDGSNFTAILAAMDAVEAALDALAIGTKLSVQRVFQTDNFAKSRPASKAAQRETKLFISGQNHSTYKPKKLHLGTFDTDKLATIPTGNKQPSYVDLTAGDGAALKTALEAYWADGPDYLVAVDVLAAYHVGANT
jgi:hypothetical protein